MFAEIIVYTNIPIGLLTYQIPAELAGEIKIGQIVEIDFRGRMQLGLIYKFIHRPTEILVIKEILRIINPNPLSETYIELLDWISIYYFVSFSESLTAIMPEPVKEKHTLSFENLTTNPEPDQKYLIVGNQKVRWKNYYDIISKTKLKSKQIILCFSTIKNAQKFSLQMPNNINFGFYFSSMTKKEKYKTYINSANGQYDAILGVRSVVFLPLPKLKTIVIDDPQSIAHHSDQKPYLSTEKIATWLAKKRHLNTFVGALFPSASNWYDYKAGRSKLMQNIEVLTKEKMQIIYNSPTELLATGTIDLIKKFLIEHKKVYIFMPGIGFGQVIICRNCHQLIHCSHCGRIMNVKDNQLSCQHCGNQSRIPELCPNCNDSNFNFIGHNLPQLKYELNHHFGMLSQKIVIGNTSELEQLEENYYDLVVGMNCDFLFEAINYDQDEKAYTLLYKLLSLCQEKFLLQSATQNNLLITNFNQYNFKKLLELILVDRKKNCFPPFGKIAKITYGDNQQADALKKIKDFKNRILAADLDVLGPYETTNFRKSSKFYEQIIVKFQTEKQKKIIIDNLDKKFYFELVD